MTDPTTPTPVRKGRGCFFYGCLTGIVLLVMACLLAFFAVRWVGNQIKGFTDAAPMELPKVEMADKEFAALEQRVKTFGDAMAPGKTAAPLVLTERELNALIAGRPDMKELAGKVYVSLSDSQVKGQVSIPLGGLGWLGKGRYLNGEATFNVSLENGVLIVTAEEIRVQDKPLPEVFMKEVRKENLATDVYKDPKNAQFIRRLDSIQVQDGCVIIKGRARE